METEDDYFEVENMVRNSFWNVYRPGAFEHYIVHNLRDDESFLENLTYVMESNDGIIGYIGYSEGFIDYGDERIGAVVLGPLAIHEDFQNHGLGSKLIDHTLNLARDEDIPFVFVVGDEDYYRRFGFISASEYDLYLEGTDMGEECPFFMIRLFDESELKDGIGIFHNPDVFDVNPEDVDEFDKKFEYRQKKVLEGQLEGL
ncbi:GNAT family N-acetyltransferase [uncultured Methanobrevibacter sp.]|uniref:GNAT family N-acetyltransferase n=1 Tax=uncultured Methanobrevibacter sp. TaxID=253161 RepID=UPI0025D937AD|nr:N-acetyltransferase [uncultured Methanobrevibacter sp.]